MPFRKIASMASRILLRLRHLDVTRTRHGRLPPAPVGCVIIGLSTEVFVVQSISMNTVSTSFTVYIVLQDASSMKSKCFAGLEAEQPN